MDTEGTIVRFQSTDLTSYLCSEPSRPQISCSLVHITYSGNHCSRRDNADLRGQRGQQLKQVGSQRRDLHAPTSRASPILWRLIIYIRMVSFQNWRSTTRRRREQFRILVSP